MKKKIFIALLGALVLGGVLAGVKYLQITKMMAQSESFRPPPTPVTATQAVAETWEILLPAVGSLSAVQGVTVAAEVPGKVVEIAFEAGQKVAAGELLVRQDASTEQALLPGAQGAAVLARSSLERTRTLLEDQAVSQSDLDEAVARHQQAVADLENLRAAIAKKSIVAPFGGRLGVRQVNLGQILQSGNEIVSLQALNPIFVDFFLPQQHVGRLKPGLAVKVSSDAFPGREIVGKITTISPKVEETTRNIRVQATIDNPDEVLRPGMYVDIAVVLPEQKKALTVPLTAILYAPYGNTVFVVEGGEAASAEEGDAAGQNKVLRQQVVELGEKRGDFVDVLSGLQPGEQIVTTGVFKLRNGMPVVVDNSLQPEFKLEPEPENK